MKLKKQSKIWSIIKKSKILRSLNLLIVLLILLVVVLISMTFNYRQKIQANQMEIEKNQILLQNLQTVAQAEAKKTPGNDLFRKKSFANYEEVVPFIAFLESLFTVIDPDAEVIIKSKENQIFIDHFADYTVYFEVNENKELIFKALDELDKSRFIINILNFSMDYKPAGDENLNQLSEFELVIRLFLK